MSFELRYRIRHWRLSRDPRRAVHCNDLECLCDTCTTEGCPCAEWRVMA